jgi:hypothetical protein
MLLELVRETRNDVHAVMAKLDRHIERVSVIETTQLHHAEQIKHIDTNASKLRDVEAVQDAHSIKLEQIEEAKKYARGAVWAAIVACVGAVFTAAMKWISITPPAGHNP